MAYFLLNFMWELMLSSAFNQDIKIQIGPAPKGAEPARGGTGIHTQSVLRINLFLALTVLFSLYKKKL